ncbi:MAG TPA: hypothetical protein VFQ05_14855 [Candidatus Eisenbacteria bacterium]|nr:hypothetical protein [Candidatus Eisenbacteria bacterium]
MSIRDSIAVMALGLTLAGPALASDVGYIYGRVETESGSKYTGQLRWGTEEAFWDDIFNATKAENENLADLDPRIVDDIKARHWKGWDVFGVGEPELTHLFAIRFGDLKRLEVRRHENVVAEFRNGEELQLKGGSNDVGAKITVIDKRSGKREIPWDKIRTVEFMDTPTALEEKLGEPIYGTVKSGRYDFTGRIQWDNDETLTTDKLDGDSPDGKAHVEFGEIAGIRKHRSGVMVRLRSGDEVYLRGTNDVNSGNRGVVVIVPRLGSVKIGWDDFDEVTFSRAPNSGRSYAEYAKGKPLVGTVVTRDGRLDGQIVFDLDESRDFELLHGTNGVTEYLIPFREIASIRPEGSRRSVVQLRMGLNIELEESQDVTRDNDGLLVFAGGQKPSYVEWRDVTEVRFR